MKPLAFLAATLVWIGSAGAMEMRVGPAVAPGSGVVLPPIVRPTPTTTTPAPVTTIPLNYSRQCSGGGTRATAGSWDVSAGKLDVTTTYTACIVSFSGEQQDGASTAKGAFALTNTALSVDLTFADNLTVTRRDGTKVTYTCNRTKKGAFDQTTHTFDGTSAITNCTTSGKVRDFEGIAEYLLREYAVLSGTAPAFSFPFMR